MEIDNLKEKLKGYSKDNIIITYHAQIRALERNIDLEEVKKNIINPSKLVYFKEQKPERKNEYKYECYFSYSKNYCHKYILTTNGKVIIVTIISINREWQRSIK